MILQGAGPVLLRNPKFVLFFRERGGPPVPLWIRPWIEQCFNSYTFVTKKQKYLSSVTTLKSWDISFLKRPHAHDISISLKIDYQNGEDSQPHFVTKSLK